MPAPNDTVDLFAYGSLLPGERDHDLLAGATHVGPAVTPSEYYLIELNGFPALVIGGRLAVHGEIYRLDRQVLRAIDVRKENPILFHRKPIRLADGTPAQTYLMTLDQVRARRRLKVGDWRKRFEVPASGIPPSPWRRGRLR
jgi:gamma-glutamylcyclotransferase (GGCT)/AIG2-like uncharacterized protein YtfP